MNEDKELVPRIMWDNYKRMLEFMQHQRRQEQEFWQNGHIYLGPEVLEALCYGAHEENKRENEPINYINLEE